MTSDPAPPVLLITGITGYFAAHVLDAALADPANYRIRGTTRDLGKRDALLARLTDDQAARIELVQVKDIATDDLTEAVKDVSLIAHVACPCNALFEDVEREMMIPSIDGTLNVLRAAAKEASVKRVALTSSVTAMYDFSKGADPSRTLTKDDWTSGERGDVAGTAAYSVAKALAEKAAWAFIESNQPSFQLATFQPSILYGAILQPVNDIGSLNATSMLTYRLIAGLDVMPPPFLPLFCHARDAADAHIRWLSKPDAPSQRYPLSAGTIYDVKSVEFISQQYPHLVDRLPKNYKEAIANAKNVDLPFLNVDCSDATSHLGIVFRDWRVCLKETLESLLELEKKFSV